jgi:4-diphosphocytidyl-2C-methyl-D-erythritol kinase
MSGSGATVFAMMYNDMESVKSSEALKSKFPICIATHTSPFGLEIA